MDWKVFLDAIIAMAGAYFLFFWIWLIFTTTVVFFTIRFWKFMFNIKDQVVVHDYVIYQKMKNNTIKDMRGIVE